LEYWATPAAAVVDSVLADAPVAAAEALLDGPPLDGALADVDELLPPLQAASARVSAPRQATLRAFKPYRFRWGVYVIVWALQRNRCREEIRGKSGERRRPARRPPGYRIALRNGVDRFDVHVLFR